MLRTTLITVAALAAGGAAQAEPRSGALAVNGIDYAYQIQGEGAPLLLLHGGLGTLDMFAPILPALTGTREVIAVDLQGHGRTPLGDRPISLEAIGDDMGALVAALGYERLDVLGYSFGAGVGLQMAAQHPETVGRLALVSAPFAASGWYPDLRAQQAQVGAGMAEMMQETPMYRSYAAVAPDVAEFPRLLDAMGAMMRQDYDYSEQVRALPMPVMLVFGDGDMVRPEHVVAFYQLLGGGLADAGWNREAMPKSRLAILPNRTHYDMFFAPGLVPTVLPFLNGEDTVPGWIDQF
jgi:pimeloyl-ACP methyl ester carboxylesterase